jgi:DNA (cytosine-5)-methyltransferase 1
LSDFALYLNPTLFSAAARTYQRNYPGVIVYNEDGNDCLARAEGLVIPDQRDVMGNPVKPMPKRGEVPGMTAGIPCEGYSGTNYCPKADDIKNTLVTMLLSFIDHYRPKYVLLENVTGILRHKLGAEQHSKNRTKGGIPKGTMK